MSVLTALFSVLETAGVGTESVDLFIDVKPQGIDSAVIIRRTGGTRDTDYEGKLRRTDVQLVITGATYEAAELKAEEAAEAIRVRQTQFDTDGVFIYRCDADHDPIPVGREDSGVETMVVNCTVIWR